MKKMWIAIAMATALGLGISVGQGQAPASTGTAPSGEVTLSSLERTIIKEFRSLGDRIENIERDRQTKDQEMKRTLDRMQRDIEDIRRDVSRLESRR